MSSIYTRRFFKANNKHLEDYNPEEPSSYLLNIDANNLYGGIMKHCPLPMKNFSITEESLEDILKNDDNSEWGYILEVDLSIPQEIPDCFADYPPDPSREVIVMDKLRNAQIQMLGEIGVTSLPKKPKLVQTLDPKEGYVLHYLTLKLYIELGLQVDKGLEFLSR